MPSHVTTIEIIKITSIQKKSKIISCRRYWNGMRTERQG
jgi:hypothetical protein